MSNTTRYTFSSAVFFIDLLIFTCAFQLLCSRNDKNIHTSAHCFDINFAVWQASEETSGAQIIPFVIEDVSQCDM